MGQRYTGKGYSIEWFGDDLKRVIDTHNDPAMFAAGQALKREAQRRAPVAMGTLKASAYVQTDSRTDRAKGKRDRRSHFRKRGKGGVLVAFAAFYANMLEDSGARRHRIPGAGKKVIRIAGVGFRASAEHPGMQARPFLGPALEATKDEITRAFVGEMGPAIEGALPHAN